MSEIIICDSCHFSFDVADTGCEICLTCLKGLRLYKFIREHQLCRCGDDFCVGNTKAKKAQAEKLERLANHVIVEAP